MSLLSRTGPGVDVAREEWLLLVIAGFVTVVEETVEELVVGLVTVVEVVEIVGVGGGIVNGGRLVVEIRCALPVAGAEVVVVGGLCWCSTAVITFEVVVIGLVGLK